MLQLYTFFIFILLGIIISFIFDFFRILRKAFNTNDMITYLEDFIFCTISGFLVIYSIFYYNNGELRLYLFIGIGIGIFLYILLLTKLINSILLKLFIPVNIFINKLKNILKKVKKTIQKNNYNV